MINDYETTTGKPSELDRDASLEDIMENEDVKSLISSRLEQIGKISDDFIENLIGSLETIPYGLRWICKQIKKLMIQYFPESTEIQHCSMIGGFFLLRFVNPAIVAPHALMLIDTKVSPTCRRNLTLVCVLNYRLILYFPFTLIT